MKKFKNTTKIKINKTILSLFVNTVYQEKYHKKIFKKILFLVKFWITHKNIFAYKEIVKDIIIGNLNTYVLVFLMS